MIKNIIFDYGNTLVEFEPRNIALRFGVTDEEEIKLICEKLFDRKYWDRLDEGTLPQEEFVEKDIPQDLADLLWKLRPQTSDSLYNEALALLKEKRPYLNLLKKLHQKGLVIL